ncbi:S-DNA-T family DNA segregation ATPase FtsK/SpoIIIE [Geomicrobium halophilum]|uniref:S-DNA-T family DNA segregation ATPase FtsK/SpoIIIE n=1 Tax=Geomicrobium halophilum TaxID=549000 RepID=A0A841PSH7_9BACL|nr:DNA translocase FtsK [Geomicrobium halophilum]MBB6449251.1 S-DNA-T family DNA segregation ATPase FtsK/SpoIIIE [Geomicrobium halophilum]
MGNKKKKRKKKKQQEWTSQLKFELSGLVLLTLAVIATFTYGPVGTIIIQLFRFFTGEWHHFLTALLYAFAITLIFQRTFVSFWSRRLAGIYLLMFTVLLHSHLGLFENLAMSGPFQDGSVIMNTFELYTLDLTGQADDLGGGMIGALGYATGTFLFDVAGTQIFALLLVVISFILISGKSLTDSGLWVWSRIKRVPQSILQALQKLREERKQEQSTSSPGQEKTAEVAQKNSGAKNPADNLQNETASKDERPVIHNFKEQVYQDTPKAAKEKANSSAEGHDDEDMSPLLTTATSNEDYRLPALKLLSTPVQNKQTNDRSHVSSNAKKLEDTLQSFGVQAQVNEVHLGPAVTKYEVQPATGVKVSKIVSLTDDIALALAAKDIRIEAPIPGKSAVGIEVPNQDISMVTLREVLETEKAQQSHVLSVGLGRDISGEPMTADLHKMPHLLVAGATGSGKSVCINGIVTSILMKAKPNEVKLMMIDPKMVELNVYNGIPHLLTPVVTEPKKAAQALKKVVAEMERRYDLFSHSGSRNIEGYNEMIRKQNEKEETEDQPKLPYIVVIVDELADLMMVASSDVEDAITRLAQMARAAGIHMIIATQRPSVDVITGVIKANIPSRIAFGVSSQTDSRTILDAAGAEKLLGRGDMLFVPVGANKSTRIQGAFISDEEVEAVVADVVEQQKASYQEEMMPEEVPEQTTEPEDELYHDAVSLVVQMNSASVSMLQRRFRIGYTRAARLVDEMEAQGIVGPYEGKKPREVLYQPPEDISDVK